MHLPALRLLLVALTASLVLTIPALGAKHSSVSPGCQTRACAKRVCKSIACKRRTAPKPVAHESRGGYAGGILAAIRQCENSGNYKTVKRNGFWGAYQFTLQTWYAYGGKTHPGSASPAEQDRVAMNLLRAHGVHSTASWPNCP